MTHNNDNPAGAIAIGDKVHFVSCRRQGQGLKATTRYAVVMGLHDGNLAEVRLKNGRRRLIRIPRLRKEGARHHLTDLLGV